MRYLTNKVPKRTIFLHNFTFRLSSKFILLCSANRALFGTKYIKLKSLYHYIFIHVIYSLTSLDRDKSIHQNPDSKHI